MTSTRSTTPPEGARFVPTGRCRAAGTRWRVRSPILIGLCVVAGGCATVEQPDPLESVNRKVFDFNEGLDKVVLQPTASVYKAVVPSPVRPGISNFFSNLADPWSAANLMLQGRPKEGFSDLGRESADPRPTIQGVLEYMGRVADRHSVRLGLRIDDDVPPWQVDRSALFTLLKNLLENAIQHRAAGGVVTRSVHANGFSVTDEGPGMAAEHLPRMFDRFWRSPERRDEGAGLGLAICREVAIAHGWQLGARCRHEGLEVYAVMDAGNAQPAAAGPPVRLVGQQA